ncbi:MAG: CoA ester lyase [Bauldia sp.]|nr:CoA ester lyase [Bauldia sp.]MCW5719029.1 CoA ester lyase [Bauldia sp.]
MSATFRPRRSVLFLPGGNPKAISKARTIAADVLVFDLEDAVAPENKEVARRMAVDAVAARADYGDKELVIRINGLESRWAAGDIAAAVPAAPDAILVPKISRPEDVRRIRAAMRAAGADPAIAIWAMMETPLAILNAGAIGATGTDQGAPLAALVVGTNDLAAETEVRPGRDRAPMLPWLSTCVLSARAYELAVIDGIYNDFNDADGFAAECAQARMLGMDGKSVIHPNQVAPCNQSFTPSAEEIIWAQSILAAFDRAGAGTRDAVTVNGRVVERLHARIARRMLATARIAAEPVTVDDQRD